MYSATEKRKHPRLAHSIPIAIKTDCAEFTIETKNISCMGAYCSMDQHIKPMTKLAINMDLPIKEGAKANKLKVCCKGVVVRSEEVAPNIFSVAIFFNDITESQKGKISRYISQFLTP